MMDAEKRAAEKKKAGEKDVIEKGSDKAEVPPKSVDSSPAPPVTIAPAIVKAVSKTVEKVITTGGGSEKDVTVAVDKAVKALGESDDAAAEIAGKKAGELTENKGEKAATHAAVMETKEEGGSVQVQAAAAAATVVKMEIKEMAKTSAPTSAPTARPTLK